MRGRRIGIDARSLVPPVTGTGVVLRSVLRELARLAPDNDWFCYTTRPLSARAIPSGRFHVRVGRGVTARFGTVWLQTGLVSELQIDEVELFWSNLQILPLPVVDRIGTVVTLQDLVFLRHPQTMTWRNRIALGRFARPSLQGADRVMTATEATRRAAVAELGVPDEKIVVAPYGVDEDFKTPIRRTILEAVARVSDGQLTVGDYLLFVGTLEPRKNLRGLLTAVADLVESGRFAGRVALVGGSGWKGGDAAHLLGHSALRGRVVRLGYVEKQDLPAIYAGARLFVLPSIDEGFGFPLLEAMACGTPVVASEVDTLVEVAGGAAHLAPTDSGGLARAIDEVWNSVPLRHRLTARGLERVRDFSWRACGERHLEVFEQVLESRAAGARA